MQIVRESAEHHFLTLLDRMKREPGDWAGILCGFSRRIDHDTLVGDLTQLQPRLAEIRQESAAFLEDVAKKAERFNDPVIYQFADSDILLVTKPNVDGEKDSFYTLFKEISGSMKSGLIDYVNLGRDVINAQKLADRKFLAQKKVHSYAALGDANRVASINLRRQRRDNAVILIVEDDRFTATYTTNILSKVYEVVHAKSGEEAILAYIDHAPDAVFLDIHLPGIDGHETLSAIRQADPEAYVVMLSVDTVKPNIVSATSRGASGFLKKPFSKERILAIAEKSPFIRGTKSVSSGS